MRRWTLAGGRSGNTIRTPIRSVSVGVAVCGVARVSAVNPHGHREPGGALQPHRTIKKKMEKSTKQRDTVSDCECNCRTIGAVGSAYTRSANYCHHFYHYKIGPSTGVAGYEGSRQEGPRAQDAATAGPCVSPHSKYSCRPVSILSMYTLFTFPSPLEVECLPTPLG